MKLLTVVLLRCKLVALVSLSLYQRAVMKLPVSPALCQLLCHPIQLAGKLLVSGFIRESGSSGSSEPLLQLDISGDV